MKLITQRSLIKNIVKSWASAYPEKEWPYKQDTLYNLKKLDLNKATGKDIANIIGNDSWTIMRCNECNKDVKHVVQLGQEPDYESATAQICFSCLNKAVKLSKTNEQK